jgi:hypothetical protein
MPESPERRVGEGGQHDHESRNPRRFSNLGDWIEGTILAMLDLLALASASAWITDGQSEH